MYWPEVNYRSSVQPLESRLTFSTLKDIVKSELTKRMFSGFRSVWVSLLSWRTREKEDEQNFQFFIFHQICTNKKKKKTTRTLKVEGVSQGNSTQLYHVSPATLDFVQFIAQPYGTMVPPCGWRHLASNGVYMSTCLQWAYWLGQFDR